ncbi:cysteine desulfurase [Candidatus Micrarchaeota archaeon]|nr:cysteine desulfurase [Candidatus Micrarchaeota archaeon]
MDVSELFQQPAGMAYFDSAATSLTCTPALEKMQEYYRDYRANIHRGAHRLTLKASDEYESVYGKLAHFFQADAQEFTAVRNTTEAVNAVALGLEWSKGDEVIVTDIEHHSNLLPWLRLKKQGVLVRILESDAEGRLSPEKLVSVISKKTRLVSFTACSNVLGGTIPITDLASTAKKAGALVFVDAAQYVGHHPVSLKQWPVDFLAFSGHKSFGPTGIGVLFHRKNVDLSPWFVGGGTVRDVSLSDYNLLKHRERFEAGTPPIAEWLGLGAALDVINQIGYSVIQSHDQKLIAAMLRVFQESPHVTLFGSNQAEEKAGAIFPFSVKNVPHHQAAVMLDQLGFACRSGHHCAIPLTKKLGVPGTVRASLHVYNTEEQVTRFGEALKTLAALS